MNLGVSYERVGELDLALREYERAATGSMKSLALTYQGNVHATRENISMAERKYRAALKADSSNVIALNNLAWLLVQEGGSLDEAESLILHALELDPEPRESYENTLKTIRESR